MAANKKRTDWLKCAQAVARGIRRRVLEHTIKHNGGYLSQACSASEILAALYLKVMNLAPTNAPLVPKQFAGVPGASNTKSFTGAIFNGKRGKELDRFILSPSQYSLVLYAALIELGRMAPEGLDQFNRDGSTVEMIGAEHSPGMEIMSGSLGQGLAQAAGIALARKLRGETGRMWVFMSDGEFQSGMTWETLQTLAFQKIGRFGIYVDVNAQQCDGRMADVMAIEPLHDRVASFGAKVVRVDGHDLKALAAAAEKMPEERPLVILCDTDPCRGVELLRVNAPKLHYLRFKTTEELAQYEQALERMG